jgi:ribosomal-protein-alanine N-acetyltransferase
MGKIQLREVDEKDCDILFNWANDKDVRQNSFSCEKIMYENHLLWFETKIHNDNCCKFILMDGMVNIGMTYLDVVDGVGKISYSISRDFRGKGYGTIIIEKLEEKIKECELGIHELYAEVKYKNMASQKIFKKLGYKEYILQDRLAYKKEL